MKITEDQVQYVADLANLKLSKEEVHQMAGDLAEILTHIETLNELDTAGVEPMAQVLFEAEESTLRPDREWAPLGTETAVANAQAAGGGYFKVPKVIER